MIETEKPLTGQTRAEHSPICGLVSLPFPQNKYPDVQMFNSMVSSATFDSYSSPFHLHIMELKLPSDTTFSKIC